MHAVASTTEEGADRTRETGRRGALMIVGTTSGAGKSTLVTALCRAFARRGAAVAPFKAQNMSNHSAVTPDGGEIGRAQAMQAMAAGIETDRRMGPVLLKPSGAHTSHLVVLGEEVGVADAAGYGEKIPTLRPVVLDALSSLRQEHALVVLEGAGGAAEINLFDRDLVNLPLAAAAGVPTLLVVDIERGGAFATAFGTWALLPEQLRRCLRGFVLNSFRGDPSLLDPGLRELERRTGVPVLGILPHLGEHVMLGLEDSLDLDTMVDRVAAPDERAGREQTPGTLSWVDRGRRLRVAVLRLPHLANPSDLDPLVLEPSVDVRWASGPAGLTDADLVVLPGSRATVTDLAWVRSRGLDHALGELAADPRGPFLVGICAGFQMLGTSIDDSLESGAGRVTGLGLLPVSTVFGRPKVVTRSRGAERSSGATVEGYHVRWGRLRRHGGEPWLDLHAPARLDGVVSSGEVSGPEGCLSGDRRVRGTSLHGVLDQDRLRHSLLREVANARGRSYVEAPATYHDRLEAHADHLARWAEDHLDVAGLLSLAGEASPPGQGPGW